MAPTKEPKAAQLDPEEKLPPRILILITRYLLPAICFVIGILFIIAGHGRYKSLLANRDSLYSAVGVAMILIAGSIILLNWMLRMNNESYADRAKEQEARDYFVRTGHWPDEN